MVGSHMEALEIHIFRRNPLYVLTFIQESLISLTGYEWFSIKGELGF